MMRLRVLFFFLLPLFCLSSPLSAAYTVKNGTFINVKDEAIFTVEEHFNKGVDALKKGDLDTALSNMRIVWVNFPHNHLGTEALYYLGVIYYQKGELDIANKMFNSYLKVDASKEHFEDLYRFKESIAERFANGERRHLFSWSCMPQWQTGKGLAIEIFDEVAQALSNHELAAQALLQKGAFLIQQEQFQEAERAFQQVIKRFPLSSFSKQAFQSLAKGLEIQSQKEPQNRDILDLAEINVREFEREFGNEDSSCKSLTSSVHNMKEKRAESLYETGQLFERMNKPKAAVIYYALVVNTLQDTTFYSKCVERLKEMKSYATEMHLFVPL